MLLIPLADFDTISKFVQLKVFLVEIKDAFILVSLVSLDTEPTNTDVLGNLLSHNIFEQNYSSYNFVDCILAPYLLESFFASTHAQPPSLTSHTTMIHLL